MCLEHPGFMSILLSSDFYIDLDLMVLDECHCTFDWGDAFRKAWNNISKIRALVKHGIPILAVSATMTPAILAHVRNVLAIDPKTSAHLNLGNDRPNIAQLVHRMPKAKDFDPLVFIFCSVSQTGKLPRTIVYFATRDLAQKGMHWLRQNLPNGYAKLASEIDYIHAGSELMKHPPGQECR
jgi:superfamily II DNA helicase RecQ